MANTYADRVKETTTTTGTGTYDLDGAEAGHQTFVAGAGDASTVYYVVEDGTDWEVGTGTVTDAATDTLSRDTIHASSNAGSAVNWGAGSKNVSLTLPAEKAKLPQFAVVNHQIANGSNVSAGTADTWVTYPLNTVQYNPDSILSLASNQVTLVAGTYKFNGFLTGYRINQMVTRLRNVSDASTTLVGQPFQNPDISNQNIWEVPIQGVFSIAASKTFEVQYWCDISGFIGLGNAAISGAGVDNIHGQFIFERVSE